MATSITKTFSVGDTVYVKVPYTNLVGWIAIEKIVSLINFTGAGNVCIVTFTDNTTVVDSTATPTVFATAALCDTAIVNDVISKAEAAVVEEASITTNVSAVAQQVIYTLAGMTAGTLTLNVNGVDYSQTFAGTMDNTTDAFVSFNAADFNTAGITLTHPSANQIKLLANVAGTPFRVIKSNIGSVKQSETWTKTSYSGLRINIAVGSVVENEVATGGSVYSVNDNGSFDSTATLFVTTHAATFLSQHGIVITHPSTNVIQFEAVTAGVGYDNLDWIHNSYNRTNQISNAVAGTLTESSVVSNVRAETAGKYYSKISRSY